MSYYEFKLPAKILSGEGALEHVPHELQTLGASRPLLLSDQGLAQVGTVKIVQAALRQGGLVPAETYCHIPPDSSIEVVNHIAQLYRDTQCDSLIAVGGGSVIDTAKGVGMVLAQAGHDLLDSAGCEVLPRGKHVPFVAVPTTAGTGSEVTLAAVITDEKSHYKYPINDFALIPRYAVHDWRLTRGLPPAITGQTGMDALTHAVEAYIGRGTTRHTRRMATEAVRLVHDNLLDAYRNGGNIQRAYEHGDDHEARENMLHAAYKAGIAFSMSYVGYAHAIAHSLGGQYGVPHGLANAVILPHVLRAYGDAAAPRLAELARTAGVCAATDSDAEGAAKLIAAIKELNASMNIPEKISGIKRDDIAHLAHTAEREANPLYPVPKLMTEHELAVLYEEIADWNE